MYFLNLVFQKYVIDLISFTTLVYKYKEMRSARALLLGGRDVNRIIITNLFVFIHFFFSFTS